MPRYFFTIILLLTFSYAAFASSVLKVGQKLPLLMIEEGGAIFFDSQHERHLAPWSTLQILHKKRIIQYLPARLSSRANLHLNEAVHSIDHPARCRTVSIINYTDAIPGTWIFIEPEMARTKKLTPLCDIVLDKLGLGQKRWDLPLETNITIVVDENNIIEFYYEGKLNEKQVEMIIDLTNPEGVTRPAKMVRKLTF